MKTIRITGIGTASISPNQIELNFHIKTLDPDYNNSLEKHDIKLNEFNSIIKELNFKKEDLKTNYFNISPKYKSIRGKDGEYKEFFEGYEVNQNLILTFDYDMNLLDKIISELSKSNIKPRFNINFTIKEKLNTISIVLIVIISAIVIGLVGTFIWLRTRMKVR